MQERISIGVVGRTRMTLLRTPLGSTGEQVSVLGCGTFPFRDMSQDATDEALNHCLDRGVTYFDCARNYGDAEIKLGRAIGHRRSEYFMATKALGRDAGSAYQQISESCDRLRTDYLDLLQFHYVNRQEEFDQIMGPDGALEGAIRAQEEGLVRHVGITGHRPEKLAEWLETGAFATVLFHLSPLQPFAASELLPTVRRLGIGSMAMRPVGSGLLSNVPAALRYVRSHRPDVIVSGLTTPAIVDANIQALQTEVGADEAAGLEAVIEHRGNNGCRRCNYCSCPVGINITDTLIGERVADDGGISKEGQEMWAEATQFVHKCADHEPCKTTPLCEAPCPYNLPIRKIVMRVASA